MTNINELMNEVKTSQEIPSVWGWVKCFDEAKTFELIKPLESEEKEIKERIVERLKKEREIARKHSQRDIARTLSSSIASERTIDNLFKREYLKEFLRLRFLKGGQL